jgi:hypothetical protein
MVYGDAASWLIWRAFGSANTICDERVADVHAFASAWGASRATRDLLAPFRARAFAQQRRRIRLLPMMAFPRSVVPTIAHVAPATDREWQLFWDECSTATYFHSLEWAKTWAAYSAGRIRPAAKLVYFTDGMQALVPLSFEVKAGGLLSRYAASTGGTYGGWLYRQPLHITHARELVRWLTQDLGKSLVWRLNPYDELAFRAGVLAGLRCKSDETHAIELPQSADELLKGFKATYRTQIRRAIRSGELQVEPAQTLEDYRDYFAVYQDSLARWGDEPETGYSWRLFEHWFRLGSPNVKLWVARQGGKIVSGDVCLYSAEHVVYWHGATLRSHLQTSVSKLLKFEVMKDAIERGKCWYDFNPSAGLGGVKFFKEGFNPRKLPAPMVYVDTRFKRFARSCAASVQVDYARLALRPLRELCSPPQDSAQAD